MYAIDDKLDILTSFAGSYIKNEYINYFTFDPKSESRAQFDSSWIGFSYRTDKINNLIPIILFNLQLFKMKELIEIISIFILNHLR